MEDKVCEILHASHDVFTFKIQNYAECLMKMSISMAEIFRSAKKLRKVMRTVGAEKLSVKYGELTRYVEFSYCNRCNMNHGHIFAQSDFRMPNLGKVDLSSIYSYDYHLNNN